METRMIEGGSPTRRRFLRLVGGASAVAGGLSFLSACKSDGIVDATSVPVPAASSAAAVVPPPYTPTDADRMNFALQLHYFLAGYLHRGIDGGSLAANLTTGTGKAGTVSGGRQVSLSVQTLEALREVSSQFDARIALLRQTLGSAATAQPAINIAGGQGSAFAATAQRASDTAPAVAFDPWASETDYILGLTGLSLLNTQATNDLAWYMGASYKPMMAALVCGVAGDDAIVRNILYVAANVFRQNPVAGQKSIFERADTMAKGRDQFDGPKDNDQGIGGNDWSNVSVVGWGEIPTRKTPEMTMGILYTSAASVSSGGFFPAGLNGTIHISGANTY